MNLSDFFAEIKSSGRKNLTEFESRKVLHQYGIPLVESYLAKNVQQALAYAESVGYPVALKISSPAVVHKTEVGGYVLNIHSSGEVERAYKKIVASVRRHTNKIDGILVQKMENGVEVMVGSKKDVQFGNVLVFGFGGVLVEAVEDIAMRVVPVMQKDANEMIKETKVYRILSGLRGRKYDVKSLIKIISNTSKLLEQNEAIKELDMNPIIVSASKAVAADARIILQ